MTKGFTDYSPEDLTPILERIFEQDYNFQKRRHPEWDENYSLYRGKVKTNIFLQRQSVCLPVMKSTISTVLSKTNQPPIIKFYNKDNDKQKEIYMNGVWENAWNKWNGVLVDSADKKNNALYGRGFKTFGIVNGFPTISVVDPYDILIDPSTDPINIDATAQHQIHVNIYETVSQIKANEWFDQTEVDKILKTIDPKTGKAPDFEQENMAADNRMRDLGYNDNGVRGTTVIIRRDFFVRLESPQKQKDIIYFIPCISNRPVACLPLEDAIGKTIDDFWDDHFPIDSWADSVENLDVWSDGVADIVRNPNKLINAWWSQEVENRTLKNYSMFFYNSSVSDQFIPQTFNPYAWGFYPVPGNPNELLQQIPVPDLSGTLDQITWVKQYIEQATAATATMQGQLEKSNVTLGEVTMAVSNAQERIQSMTPYYTKGWKDSAIKFYKLIEAGVHNDYLGKVSLSKRGSKGNMFLEDVKYEDLITRNGYDVEALPSDVEKAQAMDDLQMLNLAIQTMPQNGALKRFYKERVLEQTSLSAEQINQVKQEEEENIARAEKQLQTSMMPGQQMPNPALESQNVQSIGQGATQNQQIS